MIFLPGRKNSGINKQEYNYSGKNNINYLVWFVKPKMHL